MPIRPENKARYPRDWKARSRFVRFYRAKNRCEWCGAPNGEVIARHIDGTSYMLMGGEVFDAETGEYLGCRKGSEYDAGRFVKVVLTVAHVFDDRPEASSLLNLAALCQRCHNRHDARARQERRKERIARESGQAQLF